ncbi:DEAD/DEAH box helicase [Solilutibacter silvestris]|uniref:DEAD/DEAH box helicase n=1 Tax=Solilutibacter silvestris TaxID=1645665 RepID=UPI0013FDD688|nr:DEAD/DEAH box helicase [Lysobacter silvestris]
MLTDEQEAGIHHLVSMLQTPRTSVSLINADVGVGKSIVYQSAVAYVARAGGRCAVLLPHERLAEQAFKEIRDLWPDLSPVWVNKNLDRDISGERVLVGTTALLFREIGPIDLFVTDEQHRFSVEQRRALVDQRTHIIEVSATPIPRTQAMLMYGSVNVIRLTKYHSPRNIRTRIVQRDEARVMVQEVKDLLRDPDCRLLIVCPRKEPSEEEQEDIYPLPSVQEVAEKWEALFPGKVRVAHSGADQEENRRALADVDAGRAQIIISTTIVETGVNIRGLRVLVLLHAERFGVAQTHQLRGRLSRHGGDGWCFLYLPRPIGETAMTRLQAIASTNDGLRLAELDMRTRGVGDLSVVGKRQHGSADSVIFNKTVSAELLAEMLEEVTSAPKK